MGLVVSDSSTLIHLAAIDRLALLRGFFERIVVPPAVWREVVEQGEGRYGAVEVEQARQAGWIQVLAPVDAALLQLLRRDLDDGESEVIALAIDQQAELVLLDESDARRIADLYGLSKTGVIGLLIRAKPAASRRRRRSWTCPFARFTPSKAEGLRAGLPDAAGEYRSPCDGDTGDK